VLAKCIDYCEDASRFVKTLIAFLIANVAVGLAFQAKRDFNNMMRMVTKHTGFILFFSNFFTFGFGFMYLVNLGCVLYSFLGLGCCRNAIFRERENETRRCRIIQCVLGPFCATYQQIAVFITLCIQIGLSYIYLSMGILLGFLLGMCKGGNAVVSSFQGFLDTFHSRNSYQAGSFSPMNWLMDLNVEKYCDATRGMNATVMQCFTGCLLSVLSQALMMSVISEEKGRIEGTMAEGQIVRDTSKKKKGKGGRDNDSDSDSSSSSSEGARNEVDPLRQYRQQSNTGGRNYKLPGGYQP